ncbi:MAG: spermidine/putrescine ABC transporter substrate-binding protein [Clostridia bacterium]|nr:spermidine/putrescine ABC transporter substrate-binding protein [Clostridia bacterium]
MKKIIFSILLLTALACALLLVGCGESESTGSANTLTLYIYNWGEYISDGSEGSLDVNAAFENYCRDELGLDVKVNYSTYSSNEDLYAKITSGAVSYDVIIPSDYMIARLASEGYLREIAPNETIENYQYIDERFKGLYYDADEKYSVPYTYGTVGIIYNTDMVAADDDDLGKWSLLWDTDYEGNILQFNNPRDAFGTAQFYLGYSINSSDPDEWNAALDKLKEQKAVVQGYVMDEVFNKLKGGSAAIAPYYAGDFFTMYADNELLDFYHPLGATNVFVDAMCIPANSQNHELALEYINFMLSEEVAIENAEYICYASPNTLVYENEDYVTYMQEEIHPNAIEILYDFNMDDMEFYHDLPNETRLLMNELWEDLKIESTIGTGIYAICAVIVLVVAVWAIFILIRKKIRASYY